MEIQCDIVVEPTAHPRAKKFILDRDVRTGEGVTFATQDACSHVPLAVGVLGVEGVSEVHLAGNVVTVTTQRGADWNAVEAGVRAVIESRLGTHDPTMRKSDDAATRPSIGDLAMMDVILERTIRPYIRSHGGEMELLSYDPETFRVVVNYHGTCGHCPASTSGTLEIIQQILRDEFDPRVVVETV